MPEPGQTDAQLRRPPEPTISMSMDTSFEARTRWPFLALGGPNFRNGRELGQYVAGYVTAWQAMNPDSGLQVQVTEEMLDGVFGVLGRESIACQLFSRSLGETNTFTISCWRG